MTFIGSRPRTKEVLQRRMYQSDIQKWLSEEDENEGEFKHYLTNIFPFGVVNNITTAKLCQTWHSAVGYDKTYGLILGTA